MGFSGLFIGQLFNPRLIKQITSRFSPAVAFQCIVLCLITGMSATARKRKEEVAQALKKLIQAKGKTPAMKYQQLLDDLRGQSETVSVLNLYFY